jgi:polysaccharide export outer membrane protein
MRHRTLLSLAWFALLAPAAAAQSATDPAVLTPGDSVRIVVWRQPDLSGDFAIGADGRVTHPLYRNVQIGGVPLAPAEKNLQEYLTTFQQEPKFVIEPLLRVAVSGEVVRPLVFAAAPQTTIAEAIARAGGPNQYAARNRVRVYRTEPGARRQFTVDLESAASGLSVAPIRSGDLIVVERKRSVFKDVLIPAISIAGSIAALGLLIDRYNNN